MIDLNTAKAGDRVFVACPAAAQLFAAEVVSTGCLAFLTNGEIPANSERGQRQGVLVRNTDTGTHSIHDPSQVCATPDEAAVAMLAFLSAWGESIKQWLEAQKAGGAAQPQPEPEGPIVVDFDQRELKQAQASFDRTVQRLRIADN